MRPVIILLSKAHVRGHTRRLADGKVVTVRPHDDSRVSRTDLHEAQGDLFAEGQEAVAEPPRVPQIETEAFKRWFGDSQVVDGHGKPRVVYHGTHVHDAPMGENERPLGDIDAFDRLAAYRAFDRPHGMDAVGSWFSEAPTSGREHEAAIAGAGMYGGSDRGVMYPVYLRIENPWMPKDFDEFLDKMHTTAGRNPKKQNPRGRGSVDELRAWLKSEGYDGILFAAGEIDHVRAAPVWVALDPEQIKSAIGNDGSFDPESPRLTKSRVVLFSTTSPLMKAQTLQPGERWVTVHPHGPGSDGQAILIQPQKDGSYKVIGGAGGKLNHLRLTGIKPQSEYTETLKERADERRKKAARQKERDKALGLQQVKAEAHRKVTQKTQAAQSEYVAAVSKAMGWSPEAYAFNAEEHAGKDPALVEKLKAVHLREMVKRADAAVKLNRERMLAEAAVHQHAAIGEVPLDSEDPETLTVQDIDPARVGGMGLGFATDYTARAVANGADLAKEREEAAKPMTEAQRKAAILNGQTAELVRQEVELLREPEQAQKLAPKLVEAKETLDLLKLEKKRRLAEAAAREARKNINDSVETPKAYVLETEDAKVSAKVAEDVANDLRTIATRGFLAEVERSVPEIGDIRGSVASGAYNSVNALALAAGGAALVDRSVVDVLGVAGAAEVLARRLQADLAPDEMKAVAEGVQDYHLHHYMEVSEEAIAQARELHAKAREIELGAAENGADLATMQEANRRRAEAVREAQKVLGTALGEMEANAALVVATKAARGDKPFQTSLGQISTGSAVTQLRAIGLQRGDYKIETIDGNRIVTVTGEGMGRLAKPVAREDLAQVRRNLDIISGGQDEEGWLPQGVVDRPDLDLHVKPGAAPRLAIPFDPTASPLRDLREDLVGDEVGPGQDFLVYRAGQEHERSLVGHNGGDAAGVGNYLIDADDHEKPGFVGNAPTHLHAYRVRAKKFGEYEALASQGKDAQARDAVGRTTSFGGHWHSFGEGSHDEEHLGSVPIGKVKEHLPDNPWGGPKKFGVEGTKAVAGAIRGAWAHHALEGHLRDYIGSRAADGDKPQDIVADLQSQAFRLQTGDKVGAYDSILSKLAPTSDAEGNPQRPDALRASFEAMASEFAAKRGGGIAPLQSQRIADDEVGVEALHRALAAEPTGVAAFKPIGELTPQDQRALREHFAQHVAKESAETTAARQELEHLDSAEPEKMGEDMFGDRVVTPEWKQWSQQREALNAKVEGGSTSWKSYVEAMRGPEQAYESVQELARGRLSQSFAEAHNKLRPNAPLKTGRANIANDLAHLSAVDPVARDRRMAEESQLRDSLRSRVQGRYAAGGVGDKLDAARAADEGLRASQMGFFGADETAPAAAETPLGAGERVTLGQAVEGQIAALMPHVGANFRPGQPIKLFRPTMSGGKNWPRQRAIKLLDANKRVVLSFGTGAGKTLVGLGGFAHLHAQGKVKRGLFLAPSIAQGAFGGEALRFLKPGQYKWHCKPGASREERIAAYKDPSHHFCVMTHQAFRDDMLHLGAKHAGVAEDAMSTHLAAMAPDKRGEWLRGVMEREGISFDYLNVDEGHDLLNRKGKENSALANVTDALGDHVPYYVNASADPIKNDVSEAFSLLQKMDPGRYTDQAAFMRRYGPNTLAAKDGLRRELARFQYPSKIDPDITAERIEHKVPVSDAQRTALGDLDKNLAKARIARMGGSVDVAACKAISPVSFEGVPEDQHAAVAKALSENLGLLKPTAVKRVLDDGAGGKGDHVSRIAAERKGKPGVVFAHSLDAVKALKARLEGEGYRVNAITGADSAKDKAARIDEFNPQAGEAKADILVASDAAAVGANLQRGRWLVNYDTPETAKTHAQRNGRINRIGQTNDVELIDLVSDHPEEAKRRKRLANKYALRELMTTPMESLDDTGVAHFIRRRQVASENGGLL